MAVTYRSKTGVMIPATLIMLACVSVLFLYMCIMEERYLAAAVIVLILIVVSSLFTFPIIRTRYTLDDDHLRIIAWPGTDISIDYSSITSVKGIRSTKASGPLSHDRIRIEYDGKVIYISPVNKKEFKDTLIARCSIRAETDGDPDDGQQRD